LKGKSGWRSRGICANCAIVIGPHAERAYLHANCFLMRIDMIVDAKDEWPANVIPFRWAAMSREMTVKVDPATLELVRRLRVLLRQSQLRPRSDFDRACSLIAVDKSTTTERYANAFFQGLQLFAIRRLQFFPGKAETVSNDESWLARLLLTLKVEDYTSAKYLMALRIAPAGHRRLLFLAEKLAAILCAAESDETASALGTGQSQ
jgi:hypothetical protein